MKNLISNLFTLFALVILCFAFYWGVYPNHDYVFSTFLVVWALATVWVGSVITNHVH